MSVYLAQIIASFLPAVLIAGLLFALAPGGPGARGWRIVGPALVLGLAAGWAAHRWALAGGVGVATRSVIEIAALAALAAGLALAGFARHRPGLYVAGSIAVAALLAMQGMYAFRAGTEDQVFTSTAVLNTDIILNTAAVLAGAVAMSGLALALAHIGRAVPRLSAAALLVASALPALAWGADLMLAGLQTGMLAVSSTRISIVAKAGAYDDYLTYALLVLPAVLAAAFWRRTRATVPQAAGNRAERRKVRARALTEARWMRATLGIAVALVASLLYYDLYASQPPRLSAAAPAVPDSNGEVRIAIDSVADGGLYRYAYITSDGHRVRFFLINLYDADHVRIGVVFDACMICGDTGYIQDGNEVICISCNVRIFVPSIGKAGGCNPIPMDHVVEGSEIVIARAALEDGAMYFSEIVEIEVTDPVTGGTLLNTEAKYRYEFDGRTYFFETSESYETFKASPETYAGSAEARLRQRAGERV
ncbi:Uncharacterized membrane protein [Paracoccus halophilus]|uniref:Uncharacterized membrane protein n=1 Tax=Paracoccus halophilus TaxID=376733 RepID=A0A099F834_9RHOB|nr:Fe-S-containing protein [Paracoccus halophilus]KGJ06659.1 hypothetical protein IT41_00290 [Paracoccus halophilus]SFA42381.1 Uncharacterized membrane protein [Paracoccus halophilus]